MLLWTAIALSLAVAGASEEPASCPSLLQAHQHRSAGTAVSREEPPAPAAKPAPREEPVVAPAAPETSEAPETPDAAAAAAAHAAPAAQAGYEGLPDEVIEKMVVSTPWKCDLLPQGYVDPRSPTCGLPFSETGLHPAYQTALGNSSYDHLNTMRMFYPIGALPCCSTMPFCAAPACATSAPDASKASPVLTCTKSSPADNFAYMSSVKAWPAFHGKSGSYELDVTKHIDIIGTLLRQDGRPEPVDLVIDIGYNSGFITEKLTTRHFAKNYIGVEAYKGMLDLFEERLGNGDFKEKWFNEQVPARSGAVIPDFEFLNVAVSNTSGGVLDLCVADDKMWNGPNNGTSCPVDKVALDEVIPSRLSPAFQSAFAAAESAYVKVDVEGYDQMALEGLSRVLKEERGNYSDGAQRHLVNFIQLEACMSCTEGVKATEGRAEYDVKTVTTFLESMGFETFLMGPRYLPLSHGSWDDSFNSFYSDPMNSDIQSYPGFNQWCPGPECPGETPYNTFTADLFAMRASHPRATEIKLALGSCEESHDFSLTDPQYEMPAKA